MNSDRVILPGKALPERDNSDDALQASVRGADLSSLERARMLIASKLSDDPHSQESMARGTQAAELLGKLAMGADTLAAALLLPAVDVSALYKRIGCGRCS